MTLGPLRRPATRSLSPAGTLRSRLLPASAWAEAESAWRRVFDASGSPTFFLSAEWVGAWLETFGAEVNAEIVFFDGEQGSVGATLLTARRSSRAFIPLRQIHLHTAGEPDQDSAVVEYAVPLCHPDHAEAVYQALGALVRSRDWDEFILSGVPEATLGALLQAVPGARPETDWRPTYLVDLAKLRGGGARYDSVLSKNTRDQLKRSLKLYRERGELGVTFAKTLEEAHVQLSELGVLHQQRWEERGAVGAFASARWRTFHERLITRALPSGGVQLARVRAGDTTIGVLYNFVQSGVVSFYQSGLLYEADSRLKPGQVSHALVIQECIDLGFDTYDFLAGAAAGSRYKKSLATDEQRLAWTVLRRPTLRTRVVAALRRIKRLVKESKAMKPMRRAAGPESGRIAGEDTTHP